MPLDECDDDDAYWRTMPSDAEVLEPPGRWRSVVAGLRAGDWITAGRVRMVAILLAAAYVAVWAFLWTGGRGLDPFGRAIGSDFSAFYGVSDALHRGVAAATLYDPRLLNAEIQPFTRAASYVWVYPPTALLAYLPLAGLPYGLALGAWLAVGMGTYLLATWLILPGRAAAMVATLAPAAFIVSLHGHNGLLLAACVGGGLAVLPRAPWWGGALVAVGAAMKPHLAMLVPVALLAGRRWAALAGFATTLAMLAVVATAAFGVDVWPAFWSSTALARAMLEREGVSYAKIGSIFAATRLLGASVPAAYALQALAGCGAVVLVAVVWSRGVRHDVAAATLLLAGLAATPYVYDYDLPIVTIALAFWARDAMRTGWLPWEKSLVFAAWATPLFMRALAATTRVSPLPVVLACALGVLAWQRAEVGRT